MGEEEKFIENSLDKIIASNDEVNIASSVTEKFNKKNKNIINNNQGSIHTIFLLIGVFLATVGGVVLGYVLAR